MKIVAITSEGNAIVFLSKEDISKIKEVFRIPAQEDPVIQARVGDTISITIGGDVHEN